LKREYRFFVYIMASRSLNLYIGMTNGLKRRVYEHKVGLIEGFTKRYRISRLVYFEQFKYAGNAIARETELKKWSRAKKITLIKTKNPTWVDLSDGWYDNLPKEMQIPRAPKPRARNEKL